MSNIHQVRQVERERIATTDQSRLQFLRQLHQNSTFERTTVNGTDGRAIRLPHTSQETTRAFREAFEGMSPEDQTRVLEGASQLQEMVSQFNNTQRAAESPPAQPSESTSSSNAQQPSGGVSALGASSSRALGQTNSNETASQQSGMSQEDAQQMAVQYYNEQKAQGSSNEQIMSSLQAAYENATNTVYGIAQEMQAINELRSQLGEDISELGVVIADGDYPVTVNVYNPDTGKVEEMTLTSAAQAEALKEELETAKETAGNDAQMTQLELQNALQQQMQTLQMMSQILAMLNQTANQIIGNIK